MGPISFVPILAHASFGLVAWEAAQIPRPCAAPFSSHLGDVFLVAFRRIDQHDGPNRDLEQEKSMTDFPTATPAQTPGSIARQG